MQTSINGRLVTLCVVSGGYVKYADAGDTSWTTPTNNTGETPPLNATGLIYSSDLLQKKYFVDGTNYCYFDRVNSTLETWTATYGELPQDAEGNYATMIATYRGSLWLSGLLKDPQNYFASAVDDAYDFEYSVDPISTSAFAGHLGPQGLIGDVITGLCPYTDDTMFFFCDHHIKMMRGDPRTGGSIDTISTSIGAVFGEAFCMDGTGTVYFYSNLCGVYAMRPGQVPQRISRQIDPVLDDVDTGNNVFLLRWNDRAQGMHLFISPLDAPAPTTHYFWEARTQAWFPVEFENDNHNPLCSVTFDGNLAGDRVTLVAGWDGVVRAIDEDAEDDDGYAIASSVLIGPLSTKEGDELKLFDMTAQLSTASGTVYYEVYAADTAEEALANATDDDYEPEDEGELEGGRNFCSGIQRSGKAIYIKLTSTDRWAMESVRVAISAKGLSARRGK